MATNMTHLPGYQGYLRQFQREYVSGGLNDPVDRKYSDFELESHGLMSSASRHRSLYSSSFDKGLLQQHFRNQQGATKASYKDERNAERILAAAAAQPNKQKEEWSWQQGARPASGEGRTGGGARFSHEESKESLSDTSSSSFSSTLPRPRSSPSSGSALLPSAGRIRQQSPLYASIYSSTIGTGTSPARPPTCPRFPHGDTQFVGAAAEGEGDALPALEQSLNKSLAQAIASMPAAENLLKGNPAMHGSYSRDYGHRSHHPLQRAAGLRGGPPTIDAGRITRGSAPSTYSLSSPPTHKHLFPSSSLTGPSGKKVGPHPIEGKNEYTHISYSAAAAPAQANTSFAATATAANFTARPVSSVGAPVGGGLCDMSTSRELFAGSTKLHPGLKPPGYAGFLPSAASNQVSVVGHPPHPNRDLILEQFQHDLHPQYTGHKPQAVVNVRGPRTPRGKKRMNEGMVASLILDSMKI